MCGYGFTNYDLERERAEAAQREHERTVKEALVAAEREARVVETRREDVVLVNA